MGDPENPTRYCTFSSQFSDKSLVNAGGSNDVWWFLALFIRSPMRWSYCEKAKHYLFTVEHLSDI